MPVFDPAIHSNLRQPADLSRCKSIIGRKFNRLTPLGFLGMVQNRAHWLLRCRCGTFWVADIGGIQRGYTQSCGCFNRENVIRRNTTHGQSHTRTFDVWSQMRDRCYNPNNDVFSYYGKRGITVCHEWRESFQAFLKDMGHPPTADHTIERKDNSLGYRPDNCIWITRMAQAANKRNNHRITANGETHHLAEWARLRGITREAIASRLKRRWSPEEALGFIQRTDGRLRKLL